MEFLSGIDFGKIFAIATAVLSAATVITAMTPTKADDKIVGFILKLLNFLAGNVGKNKNADDK